MKKHTLLFTSVLASAALTGCGQNYAVNPNCNPELGNCQPVAVEPAPSQVINQTINQTVKEPQKKVTQKPEMVKVTGIGYGAESTFSAYTPGQRRLMAIRASKLDAYRALAEQLHGIKIDSNTSISTLTAKNDSFRARVNAVVRGARVVSVTPMADNNYETVLEVYVDKRYFQEAFVYSPDSAKVVSPDEVCVNCNEAGSY